MKALTSEQVRALDRRAAEEYGLATLVLMENAGRRVAEAARSLLGTRGPARVVVVAGRGNNGGDGFVAARHLRNDGCDVHVWVAGALDAVRGDAAVNLEILRRSGIPVIGVPDGSPPALEADLVVDALLGTGARGGATGIIAGFIEAVNASGAPVLAIDIPSGLDADTGQAEGPCVHARQTVTFVLPKLGLLFYPGKTLAGEVFVTEIGMPRALVESAEAAARVTEDADVRARLPARPPDAHKGTFGRAFVIAGSVGMTGAAALSAEATLRAGAGLAFLGCPSSLNDILEVKLTEAITVPLPETETRAHSVRSVEAVRSQIERSQAVAIGPGLGRHPETVELVRWVLRECPVPLVVDADALNAVAPVGPGTFPPHSVITPHPGEMARLLGTTGSGLPSNRVATAERAAREWGCTVLLKGAPTVIASPGGEVWINPTGSAAMATGGTGDVLTGIIASLLAQGLTPLDAAVCGAYVHGRAGERIARHLGDAGMLAGDLLPAIPRAMRAIRCGGGSLNVVEEKSESW